MTPEERQAFKKEFRRPSIEQDRSGPPADQWIVNVLHPFHRVATAPIILTKSSQQDRLVSCSMPAGEFHAASDRCLEWCGCQWA